MAGPIREQVIVITGASSGIGRETALRAGKRGASVVLAARSGGAMREVAREIEQTDGRAEVVVTDVSDFEQVKALARKAIDRFGRIDTWVNNAAITLYGTVDQIEPEEFDRLMRVNYLGTVHGSKAAMTHMMRAGGGTIINVASVEAERAFPLQSAYSASKHAIKAFTEALRLEMRRNKTGIEVVQVNPASIDTPFFEHGRSKLGRLPMPLPPIYDPGLVADAILECAERPPRLVTVGGAGAMLTVMQRLSPALVDEYLLMNDQGFRGQMTDRPDNGTDNFDGPMDLSTYRSRGQFTDRSKKSSVYTKLALHPGLGLAILGGVALGALAVSLAASPTARQRVSDAAETAARRSRKTWRRTSRAVRHGARDAADWASGRLEEASDWASRRAEDAGRSARSASRRIAR